MPKTVSLRTGQQTSLAPGERPVGAWRRLINGIPSKDGVAPLLSKLRPLTHGFGTNATTAASLVGMTVAILSDTQAIIFAGQHVDGTSRTMGIYYANNLSMLDSQGAGYVGAAVGQMRNDAVTGAVEDVGKIYIDLLMATSFVYRANILSQALCWRPTGDPNAPVAPIILNAYTGPMVPGTDLLDIKSPLGYPLPPTQLVFGLDLWAPGSPFIVSLDEYICIVGGRDVTTDTSASIAGRAAQALTFRWAAPDTIDEWSPDLTNIPPQWFSGTLLLPDDGAVVDVVVAFSRIYVVQERGVSMLTKVGGEIGFSQQKLAVQFGLKSPAIRNCVGTHLGIFYVNSDGLYLFNGSSITPMGQEGEAIFSLSWLANTYGISFHKESEWDNVYLRGMHVPDLECVIWFAVTNETGTTVDASLVNNADAVSTVILVYNYETNQASILRPPTGRLWFPLTGMYPGIAEYVQTHVTGGPLADSVRAYALTNQHKHTFNQQPNTPIEWKTGFFSSQDAGTEVMLRKLFLEYEGTGMDNISITAEVFNSSNDTVPQQTIPIGTMVEFTSSKWKDIRIQGRYISFTFTGEPTVDASTSLFGIATDGVTAGGRW